MSARAGRDQSRVRVYEPGIAESSHDSSYQPGGRFLLRMPVSLHKQASLAAASEGVSLNQFVCGLLAAAVEWDARPGERAPRERRYPRTSEELGHRMWQDLLR
jgi:HicB family